MKTRFRRDTRRTILALSGLALLILACLTSISVLIIWDSETHLELLHEQAQILANAQDKLLNLLVIQQNWLDLRTGAGAKAMEAEVDRRDSLLESMGATVQDVATTLEHLRASRKDYTALSELTAGGIALLVVVFVSLILVAKQRVVRPMWKFADMLGRLAREDYRPEPLKNLDAFIRPAFARYNRLVGRLARIENVHQSRHQRMETQVREAARALVAQRAELARLERLAAVGEVTASVAHEVRNPLAAIRAACRSLIEDVGEEGFRERLRMIDEEVERLVKVVNRELQSVRHQPEPPRRVDVTRLLDNLVNLMTYQMPDGVTLRMTIHRSVSLFMPPNGLRQALLNLIRNSQEAVQGRGGDISIAVEQCGENEVEIRIEDTGPGFPQAMLANGVHRFVTGKQGGTGLGLAIAERYVREQGGRMEIENLQAGGARVRLVLPTRGTDQRSCGLTGVASLAVIRLKPPESDRLQEGIDSAAHLDRIRGRREVKMRNSEVMASALALVMQTALLAAPAHGEVLRAEAEIKRCSDRTTVGKATFFEQITDEGVKEVAIQINVTGLADGKHAVHVHETGKCEPCSAAKGHHDPGPFGHTAPDTSSVKVPATDVNHPFHMGDLINILVSDGKGNMKHVTSRITLSPGRLSIFDRDGSALVIHAYPDTYCDEEDKLKTGCSGGPPVFPGATCRRIQPTRVTASRRLNTVLYSSWQSPLTASTKSWSSLANKVLPLSIQSSGLHGRCAPGAGPSSAPPGGAFRIRPSAGYAAQSRGSERAEHLVA